MFTGIIEARGTVRTVHGGSTKRIVISKPAKWRLKRGSSMAVDGVCLTVVASTPRTFSADVVPETIRRSTLGALSVGARVNLERPLKLGDELGGHLLLGHVDGRGTIEAVRTRGRTRELTVQLPKALARHVTNKGSVGINGVSLTVAQKRADRIMMALVPHTLSVTNLASLIAGDPVNIETDHIRGLIAPHKKR